MSLHRIVAVQIESPADVSTYFFIFANRFFAAAEIFARVAADIARFLCAAFTVGVIPLLLPFNAWIAASIPAIFFTSEARSLWSICHRSVIGSGS